MTEIRMNRKALIDALRIGGSMSGKSKAIAILDYAKVVIKGNVLKITSSDTECCIAHKMLMANSVEGEHTFVANPRDLSNALKSLKGDEVTVWINDSYLELKHANGTMSIPTMSAEEFPLPTLESDCTAVEFDSESLFRLLNRGKEFMSADELHPIMCGVYLYVNNECYGVASTDTHKLYTESVPMASDKEVSAIVPAKAIPVLLDVINGTDKVSVSFGSRSIVVKSDMSMVSVTLPTGRFPNVKAIIPTSSLIECEIDKDELLDAINRAMLFANATGLLKLTISNMLLAIDSEDFDTQKRSYEECVCSANVPDKFLIGVNGAKLRTVLSACDSDKVTLRMNAENKPILVKEDSKTLLLMPMMMN